MRPAEPVTTTTDMLGWRLLREGRSGPQRGDEPFVLADPIEDPGERLARRPARGPPRVGGHPSVVGHVEPDVGGTVLGDPFDLHPVARDLLAQRRDRKSTRL